MARSYVKTRRAEAEAETRRQIVEAAVALHSEIGPNATTISMIAERAGVQRHTVYAHFPDERTMLMACSGLHLEREPLPDPPAWEAVNDPETRLRAALGALYGWFERNEAVTSNVLRDAETNPVLREISGMRFGGAFGAVFASFSPGLSETGQAALSLALSFYSWRTLVRDAGLPPDAAVEIMVGLVRNASA